MALEMAHWSAISFLFGYSFVGVVILQTIIQPTYRWRFVVPLAPKDAAFMIVVKYF